MEREIEIQPDNDLDSTINTLLAARARGEHVYCDFNGHILHSDNISIDSAYIEVTGSTKTEYEKKFTKMGMTIYRIYVQKCK